LISDTTGPGQRPDASISATVSRATIADVDASGLWAGKVVTEVEPVGDFWEAEPEHQDYLETRPNGYTCHFPRANWVLPKRQNAGDVQPAAESAAE
jgi:peptide-methionine (S)-S-oxide reductase